MNEDYIAGLFDGEGSAFLVASKRVFKTGTFWRIRPYIKITQKHQEVLEKIRDFLRIGYVAVDTKAYSYRITEFLEAEQFCERIGPRCYLKRQVLALMKEAISICREYQSKYGYNTPYDENTLRRLLDIRLQIHQLNAITCTRSAKWKVSNEQILLSHTKIDPLEWSKARESQRLKGLQQSQMKKVWNAEVSE